MIVKDIANLTNSNFRYALIYGKKEDFEENKSNVQDTNKELLYSSYHIDSNFTWRLIKAPGIGNSVVITNKNFGIIE